MLKQIVAKCWTEVWILWFWVWPEIHQEYAIQTLLYSNGMISKKFVKTSAGAAFPRQAGQSELKI